MKFKIKKAVQALNFIASNHGGKVNKMKALKLIWLADRLHIRKFGRTILNDRYVAMPNGPVASSTRDILEGNYSFEDYVTSHLKSYEEDRYFYCASGDFDGSVFSQSDLDCINEVMAAYAQLSKFQLSEFSHSFPEWKRWEKELRSGGRSFTIVEDDFFDVNTTKETLFDQSPEHLALSKEIFKGTCF